MAEVVVRRARVKDSEGFIGLVLALAEFEKLQPPSQAGRRRLVDGVFRKKRVNLFVAADGSRLVGYALYYYSYSSFVAKPSLYLEDLFVLEEYRKRGVGFALFRRCVDEAVAKGCGRMEWSVLTWNRKAMVFYERLGAKRLSDWCVYRLDETSLLKVPHHDWSRSPG
ncbi:MAG: GNAT family N-acetyltransferase [Nitrososphaerota archaeon]|nr:GNAT family N-acetyltransferase [Nitrososphaerota archaeon]MDG7023595.1 GNAT family N-acetyltransferase [Nitrososphaerota archaeon]